MGLQVRDLSVTYRTDAGPVRAVDSVSFDVAQGERLGLVGESGSGKTTTALALMQMLRPPGRCEGGSAVIEGRDLLALSPAQMREARLRTISYIPARRDELAESGTCCRAPDAQRHARSWRLSGPR